jgi:hypothetical protein
MKRTTEPQASLRAPKKNNLKQVILFMAVMAFIASCGNKGKTKDGKTNDSTATDSGVVVNTYKTDSLLGEYIGGFGNSTIIVSVNYINGKNASGYDIIKGNRRNIKGTMEDKGGFFEFNLAEPGGDPFDGDFKFKIDTATLSLEGTWMPFDSSKVGSKKYKLTKRKFNHDDDIQGYVGTTWYLNDLSVQFKADKTGEAKGRWWNEKSETTEEIDIPFSWFEEKKAVNIEWGKNNIFLSSKMKFKHEKNQYEDMLVSGDYIMYRY